MFCYTPDVHVTLNTDALRAVSKKGKYWKVGESIDIFFMGGSQHQIKMVKEVIREFKFVNLKFRYVRNASNSDIRISFTPGLGSWSYVGTDALFIPKNQPTLNLGWDSKSTIRHELGHAIGLLHEHMNPSADIQWNEAKVIEDLSGPPNYWDEATIRHNVLNTLDPSTVNYTAFDRDSVMLYFFPDEWTLDGNGTRANQKWSKQDKQHLMELYPHDNWFARLQRFFV